MSSAKLLGGLQRIRQPLGTRALSYSSPEYPWATQPPEITRTTAEEAKAAGQLLGRKKKKQGFLGSIFGSTDQAEEVSESEEENILKAQKLYLPTKLESSTPIGKSPPAYLKVETIETTVPSLEITTLENGLRIVTSPQISAIATVGFVTQAGSRFPQMPGTTVITESLVFPAQENHSDVATSFVNSSKEQTIYCMDAFRYELPEVVKSFSEILLTPDFSQLDMAKQAAPYMLEELPADVILLDAINRAAYGEKAQLGQLHFPSLEETMALQQSDLEECWQRTVRPTSTVLGGVGLPHQEFVDLVSTHLSGWERREPVKYKTSVYTGGQYRHQLPKQEINDSETDREKYLTRIAVGLPIVGWHGKHDMVVACVIQSLLGGGSSFSAGGPGKGMYSQLYSKALNRYAWMERAEAFANFFHETGILGIAGSAHPKRARDLTQVLVKNLVRLKKNEITPLELSRAKNMLKSNVLMQLESRLVVLEDMTRQILTYDKREELHELVEKIDRVDLADIVRVMETALEQPLSIAAVGMELEKVPDITELEQWVK